MPMYNWILQSKNMQLQVLQIINAFNLCPRSAAVDSFTFIADYYEDPEGTETFQHKVMKLLMTG